MERSEEVGRILKAAQRGSACDLEAFEGALRCAVLAAGAKMLEGFLEAAGTGRRKEAVRCSCGGVMRSRGVQEKTLLTLLGPARYRRSKFSCPSCNAVCYPGDEALDVADTSRSPGVRRQVARLGGKETFAEAARDMRELAGVSLSRKDAERISEAVGEDMEAKDAEERARLRFEQACAEAVDEVVHTLYIEFDGTGVPMVASELEGRAGKQEDGSAKTREAKIGCVFTQTLSDSEGRPVRDPGSATYTGAIEKADSFGWRIYAEALRRGLRNAERVVVLTDGAEWIKNQVSIHFPQATHIIDLYHAREHLAALLKLLFGDNPKRLSHFKDSWWELLDEGNIETLVEKASQLLPKNPRAGKDARREIAYFGKNKERMRYAKFRKEGYFVGSGVIEAACKTIVGQRLKQSGMEWTERGANAIIALRCNAASGREEDYWEKRAA